MREGWGNGSVGRALALHETRYGLLPGVPYYTPGTTKGDFWVQNSSVSLGVTPNQSRPPKEYNR